MVRDGEVLASLEIADTRSRRRRGVRGRDDIEGALLLRPASAIHTFGVRFDLDVAYCSEDLEVLETRRMPRRRVGRPRLRARTVIEARAGAFSRWDLCPGQQLEIRS